MEGGEKNPLKLCVGRRKRAALSLARPTDPYNRSDTDVINITFHILKFKNT